MIISWCIYLVGYLTVLLVAHTIIVVVVLPLLRPPSSTSILLLCLSRPIMHVTKQNSFIISKVYKMCFSFENNFWNYVIAVVLSACSVCSDYMHQFIWYNILVTDRSTVNSPLSCISGEWGMPVVWEELLQKPFKHSKQHGFA